MTRWLFYPLRTRVYLIRVLLCILVLLLIHGLVSARCLVLQLRYLLLPVQHTRVLHTTLFLLLFRVFLFRHVASNSNALSLRIAACACAMHPACCPVTLTLPHAHTYSPLSPLIQSQRCIRRFQSALLFSITTTLHEHHNSLSFTHRNHTDFFHVGLYLHLLVHSCY